MRIEIKIKGAGGQGSQTLAELIQNAAEIEKLHTATSDWDYDAVVRGGVSSADVVISNKKIINPVLECDEKTVFIDLQKFGFHLGSLALSGPKEISIPKETIEDIDRKLLGKNKLIGTILVGVLVGLTNFLKAESLKQAISEFGFSDEIVRKNIDAMEAGINLGSKLQS